MGNIDVKNMNKINQKNKPVNLNDSLSVISICLYMNVYCHNFDEMFICG